ncbi:hypothetical protein AGDE_07309 [Angomonas deanei]|uniref:Uncharacterized protein n=1 Tax=Angomonas deanei TaxID=59799 RepID=A0A7G2C676_9TRYP|nr:hypothetical protein AGDE_07309 [Angomonas deanei]CAD2215226.1 hypothetical protein, conserved [Angomonas deanei]|eukprot:EPY35475.1 hypothetical protein AGDE_07309 [Angomonas deanei]
MQRDNYAAIIRKWRYTPNMMPVRVLHLDGKVRTENLYDDVFKGFDARRIVLTTAEKAGRQRVLPDMATLRREVPPLGLVKLVPLLCTDIDTLHAVEAVCNAPGSPFDLSHRVQYQAISHRLGPGCHGRDLLCEFFQPYLSPGERHVAPAFKTLPIRDIRFDAVLARKDITSVSLRDKTEERLVSAAAYFTMQPQVTEAALLQTKLAFDLLYAPTYPQIHGNSDLHHLLLSVRQKYNIFASRSLVGRAARNASGVTGKAVVSEAVRRRQLQLAKEYGISIYERGDDGVYRYAVE